MNSDINLLLFLAISLLVLYFLYKFRQKYKVPKIACVSLITGGVKAGKSTFSVNLALVQYKRVHRRWKIRSFFQKLFARKVSEEPLLYSNIPLACEYVPITLELLQRKVRPRYGSVAYVNEASLLADQMLYKDDDINERLTLFNKLFGHETVGGYLVYDSQCIGDLHFSIKRCLSNYFYIHHLEKHFPFFLVAKVREERYSDDGTVVNSYNEDVEEQLKSVIIPKRIWKMFDAYCFSSLTDNLPVSDRVIIGNRYDLKARDIVSFRKFKTLQLDKTPAPKNVVPIKVIKVEDKKNA